VDGVSLTTNYDCYDNFTIPYTVDTTGDECADDYTEYKSVRSCTGVEEHVNFFRSDSQRYVWRYHTLFNLYAFDQDGFITPKTPQLVIKNCEFRHFFANYDSLINIESTNWSEYEVEVEVPSPIPGVIMTKMEGRLLLRGSDRGAKIKIESSTFEHSRFCKGMIVYRDLVFPTTNPLIIQHSEEEDPEDQTSYIIISGSTLYNLNYANPTLAVSYHAESSKTDATVDVKGSRIPVDAWFHKGIILNLQDFPGAVEIAECTIKMNFIFIPHVINSPIPTSG